MLLFTHVETRKVYDIWIVVIVITWQVTKQICRIRRNCVQIRDGKSLCLEKLSLKQNRESGMLICHVCAKVDIKSYQFGLVDGKRILRHIRRWQMYSLQPKNKKFVISTIMTNNRIFQIIFFEPSMNTSNI